MKAALVLLAYLLVGSLTIGQAYNFHLTHNYQADKAADYLNLAGQTDNLTQIATYLNDSYTLLLPYHGNPGWPFPTPATNYDLLRANILTTEKEVVQQEQQTTLTSYAYQQNFLNIRAATNTTASQLLNANGNLGSNPYINPLGFIEFGLLVFMWLPLLYLGCVLDDRAEEKARKKRLEADKAEREALGYKTIETRYYGSTTA